MGTRVCQSGPIRPRNRFFRWNRGCIESREFVRRVYLRAGTRKARPERFFVFFLWLGDSRGGVRRKKKARRLPAPVDENNYCHLKSNRRWLTKIQPRSGSGA